MEAINVSAYLLSSGFIICVMIPLSLSLSLSSPFCRYNKREFDFPSLREYNDYLEQVEDIGMRQMGGLSPQHRHQLYGNNDFSLTLAADVLQPSVFASSMDQEVALPTLTHLSWQVHIH